VTTEPPLCARCEALEAQVTRLKTELEQADRRTARWRWVAETIHTAQQTPTEEPRP